MKTTRILLLLALSVPAYAGTEGASSHESGEVARGLDVASSESAVEAGEPGAKQEAEGERGVVLHPAFTLRDANGNQVTGDLEAVSDIETCGQCHDTQFISRHNLHAELGQDISCFQCHLSGGVDSIKPSDFDEQGLLHRQLRPPECTACGQCHGVVHKDKRFFEYGPELLEGREVGPYSRTLMTGEVFSPQLVADSHVNVAGKESLSYPWDVHAGRGLHCVSCHYPPNDPAKSSLREEARPAHLTKDPRGLDLAEYLRHPDHRFATASCDTCHDTAEAHKNFPYPKRHMDALSCQACHVPVLRGLALESVDRTAVTADAGPRMRFRDVEKGPGEASPNTWYAKGYRPALFLEQVDGREKFSPYNLVTVWEWVSGKDGKSVPFDTVVNAWMTSNGTYRPDVLSRLDQNHDGTLEDQELVLDTDAKVRVIQANLEALGVTSPRIAGRVTSHAVRHGVVEGKWVNADCQSCHDKNSRFNQPIALGSGPFPGGQPPSLDEQTAQVATGRLLTVVDNTVKLVGNIEPEGHYIMGHSHRPWSDTLGFWIFVLSVLGVGGHATARILTRKRREQWQHVGEDRPVYMYGAYERIWHWTMAGSILVLLLTGFQVRYPEGVALMKYSTAVVVHNVFAAILLINAFLGMFYHLTTGEIQQFVPEGKGLIQRLWIQAQFYLKGIFVGASHPFVKTRRHKLNPLQQFTYAGLLNVLFPFQVVTGLLLWVAGLVPKNSALFGGLYWVAPLHNLGSWMFLAFLVVHLYLTTTGHTLTSNIKAMISGWDVEEVPDSAVEGEGS